MDAVVGSIVVATITGILTLIGVIVSNMSSNKTIEKQLEISQAVTNDNTWKRITEGCYYLCQP